MQCFMPRKVSLHGTLDCAEPRKQLQQTSMMLCSEHFLPNVLVFIGRALRCTKLQTLYLEAMQYSAYSSLLITGIIPAHITTTDSMTSSAVDSLCQLSKNYIMRQETKA